MIFSFYATSECRVKAISIIYIYVVHQINMYILNVSYRSLCANFTYMCISINVYLAVRLVNNIISYTCGSYKIITCTSRSSPHEVQEKRKLNVLYWCVAYLPSEASIIEH
jgi:hypothetical protein